MSLLRKISNRLNLFPCPNCGGSGNGCNDLCDDCLAQIDFITGTRCKSCGGTLDGFLASCSLCMKEELRPWVYTIAAYNYSGVGRSLIRNYKFNGHVELARSFTKMLIPLLESCNEPIDMFVPIPLHYTRLWWRGFNQAELIAEQCSQSLNIPTVKALKRVKRTPHQSGLNRQTRLKNLNNAFKVTNPALVANKNVWLVDDVLTTGTTLSTATKVLQQAGAAQIRVLIVARA